MAKDPAVLFYTSDFLSGTFTLSNEQVGKYIRLLCLQHQKGILSEKDMMNICLSYDEDIWNKFQKTDEGFYNKRLKEEADKRVKFTESRRNNRASSKKTTKKKKGIPSDSHMIHHMTNICSTSVEHMENENENNNINNNNENTIIKDIINTNSSKEVNEIIEQFKFLDETYQKFFANKTERKAVEALLKSVGKDRLIQVIQDFAKIKHQEYCPRAFSPYALHKSWGAVTRFIEKDRIDKSIGQTTYKNLQVGSSWLEKKQKSQERKEGEIIENVEFRSVS